MDGGTDMHNQIVKQPYESYDYHINMKKLGDGTEIC